MWYFKCIAPCPYTLSQKSWQSLYKVLRELAACDIFSQSVLKNRYENIPTKIQTTVGEKSQFKLDTQEEW